MEERPKIRIDLTLGDKAMEIIGWLTLLSLWLLTMLNYVNLPDVIPVHFNGAGIPDSYGSKNTILILPILGTLLFVVLTMLNKFPSSLNYPVNITANNAEIQYRNITRMLRYLKFALVLTFSLIVYKTCETVAGHAQGLGIWFLPLTLAITFVPVIYFVVKAFKVNR